MPKRKNSRSHSRSPSRSSSISPLNLAKPNIFSNDITVGQTTLLNVLVSYLREVHKKYSSDTTRNITFKQGTRNGFVELKYDKNVGQLNIRTIKMEPTGGGNILTTSVKKLFDRPESQDLGLQVVHLEYIIDWPLNLKLVERGWQRGYDRNQLFWYAPWYKPPTPFFSVSE